MTKTQKDRLFALYFMEAKYKGIPEKNIGYPVDIGHYDGVYCMYLWFSTKGKMTSKALKALIRCSLMVYAENEHIKIIKPDRYARSGIFKKRATLATLITAKNVLGEHLFTRAYHYTLHHIAR